MFEVSFHQDEDDRGVLLHGFQKFKVSLQSPRFHISHMVMLEGFPVVMVMPMSRVMCQAPAHKSGGLRCFSSAEVHPVPQYDMNHAVI